MQHGFFQEVYEVCVIIKEREGLETAIERNAKFWCRRVMLEYLNLLCQKHTTTLGLMSTFI